jgi:aerobic carbon-monoxide dehydrogenase medium subunit
MECELIRPETLDEALDARQKYNLDALPIAGGQSLLVMLRNKLLTPRALIDLDLVEELKGVESSSGGISIGAMDTYSQLLTSPVVGEAAPVLAMAAGMVSSTAIRNLGTIGGNVCHNELGADLPPVLMALNGTVELKSLEQTRTLPLNEFFQGYFETALEPDEILCRVEIERLPEGAGGIYLKHAISPEDLAMVGVAVVVVPDRSQRDRVAEVRIGVGGAAPVPLRAVQAEAALKGARLDEATAREAGEIAATEVDPETDAHATGAYRRKMVTVFVRRALLRATADMRGADHGEA